MDWYKAIDGTYQYNPSLNKDNKDEILKKREAYLGVTHQVKDKDGNVIENYRKDGSIMFSNETSAYNRMWTQANSKEIEESGYALANGKFLVMPDYNKKASTVRGVDISKYGYSVGDGVLTDKDGNTLKITGNVHTHQDKSGDATPSFWTGTGWGDVGHSKAMGGLPIITIGHDGMVHGAFWSIKGNGARPIPKFGSRNDLLSGSMKLIPWLQTYPTRGK
jgi:hypothetical protein